MTSPESLLLHPPAPSVTICAILSVVLHTTLLAGLGFMSRSPVPAESVPLIQISLVPSQSEKPLESSAQPQPSLRSAPRSMSAPLLAPSSSSQVLNSRLETLKSTLTAPAARESQEPLSLPPAKRVVRDHQAANMLLARSLMKMVQPQSTDPQPFSVPQPSLAELAGEKSTASPSPLTATSAKAEETQPASSFPAQRRILEAHPPGGQAASTSKVGILRFVKPVYPPVAKDAGWEGTVIVRVLVQTNGLPAEVKVQKSSGYDILDKAATEAVEQWRFNPEKDGNIPIPKYVDVPLKFELHSNEGQG